MTGRVVAALAGAMLASCSFITDSCACSRVLPCLVVTGSVTDRYSAEAFGIAGPSCLEIKSDSGARTAAARLDVRFSDCPFDTLKVDLALH